MINQAEKRILLTKYIDHTNLNPTATNDDIRKLCKEAIDYSFKSVCVHPSKIKLCLQELVDTDILICTVIGFPLGQNTITSKVLETANAIDEGANEIDMVINIAELKQKNIKYCLEEINAVVRAAQGRLVKVIVETALLTEQEKVLAFEIVHRSTAHYIKTSTGFSTSGAKLDDIGLWYELKHDLGSDLKIKAAGGVSTYDDLINFISAGADRIGTSRSLKLFEGNDRWVTGKLITYLSIRESDHKKGIVQEKSIVEEKLKKEKESSKSNKSNKNSKEKNDNQEVDNQEKDTKKSTKEKSKPKKLSNEGY